MALGKDTVNNMMRVAIEVVEPEGQHSSLDREAFMESSSRAGLDVAIQIGSFCDEGLLFSRQFHCFEHPYYFRHERLGN